MVPRAGHGRHGRPKRPSLGMLSADLRQASSGDRRPPAPSPSSAFGAASWRRHRVHTRLRMSGRTRCRGSRETLGSLSSAPTWDRSARPERHTRSVRLWSSRPQRDGDQRPTREPAVAVSGVPDALPRAGFGVVRTVVDARTAPSFLCLPCARGSKPEGTRRRKAARFTRARRAAAKPRGRHHPGVTTNASVTQSGYDSSASDLRPCPSFRWPGAFPETGWSLPDLRCRDQVKRRTSSAICAGPTSQQPPMIVAPLFAHASANAA